MARTGASGHSLRHSMRHSSGQDSGSGGSRTVTTSRSPSSSARAIRSARRGPRRAETTAWLTSRTVPAMARAAARRWTRATSVTSERSLEASPTVPTSRAGRPSPPGSRRPRSLSHFGGPEGCRIRNSSSRSPMDMWSASTTDISEGRSSGTVRPSRVSTLPSNVVAGEAEQLQDVVADLDAAGVHGEAERVGGQLAALGGPAGAGQATASAISSRHLRSSVSKPSGSLADGEQTGPAVVAARGQRGQVEVPRRGPPRLGAPRRVPPGRATPAVPERWRRPTGESPERG